MEPMETALIIILVVIFLIILIFVLSSIRIVPQSKVYIVQRLGKYKASLTVGMHFLFPLLDRVVNKISLKEHVIDFPPQPVITKDNVTMQIDTVIYYQVTDTKSFTYNVERPLNAIENLSATTLRNIIGDLELDETLTSRDIINSKMRSILDEATDPWGIKVNRVEVKNILPPRDIQESMEKQMRAEREKRESILRAEGEKRAAILSAEGEKEATILRADAVKAATIAESEGRARALEIYSIAQAESIRIINNAQASSAYVTLKGFEALEKVADGKSTKLIIPSQIQDVTSLLASMGEVLNFSKETPDDKNK